MGWTGWDAPRETRQMRPTVRALASPVPRRPARFSRLVVVWQARFRVRLRGGVEVAREVDRGTLEVVGSTGFDEAILAIPPGQ